MLSNDLFAPFRAYITAPQTAISQQADATVAVHLTDKQASVAFFFLLGALDSCDKTDAGIAKALELAREFALRCAH